MSRRVRVARPGAQAAPATAAAPVDTSFDKVVKYIPAIPGQPLCGSLLLILYTLVVARIDPKES